MIPPHVTRRLRLAGLAVGIGFFLWLPFEDTDILWPLAFAALIVLWLAARMWLSLPAPLARRWPVMPLLGALAGLLVTPMALFLMAIKTGVHGHSGPDFSGSQLLVTLERTPYWTLAGLLLGSGLALWRKT
jgi:hypothetical protein